MGTAEENEVENHAEAGIRLAADAVPPPPPLAEPFLPPLSASGWITMSSYEEVISVNKCYVPGQLLVTDSECLTYLLEEWIVLKYLLYMIICIILLWCSIAVFSSIVPLCIMLFIYLSALFLLIYQRTHKLNGPYYSDAWNDVRLILSTIWDGFARFWHGYELHGTENLPDGPGLIIYYHGAIPIDYLYFLTRLFVLKRRFCYSLADDFLFKFPGIRALAAMMNIIRNTKEGGLNVLKKGHLLGISPGGVREALFSDESYKLVWHKRTGFAQLAVDAKVKARCDDFAKHIREKIAQIRHELDSTIESDSTGEVPMMPLSPQLMDDFQLLRPDDVDKVLGKVRPTTCLLDPCPSWLLKKAKDGNGTWILEVVNASLRDGRVPAPLKEVVVRPFLKKASLDPEVATNYRPVANIPFLGKVLERVVAGQLQALLDETDYLDPFQSGFRPEYSSESALVALYDDLCRERDRGSASLLVLLDLSAAFDTIDHAHITLPIIPMYTQNVREGFRVFGRTILSRWLYEYVRWPVLPPYGGFPVKFRTYIGEPIPYDPNVTAVELAIKTKAALRSLIQKHQQIPGNICDALKERFHKEKKG
ncbi:Transmembrane protein 68 [Varanus komodoensis]|nr:Transmembrane protein 68 [Varanus komodoensis]